MNERATNFIRQQQTREQSRAQLAEIFAKHQSDAVLLIRMAEIGTDNPDALRTLPASMLRLLACLAVVGGVQIGEQVVERELMEEGVL